MARLSKRKHSYYFKTICNVPTQLLNCSSHQQPNLKPKQSRWSIRDGFVENNPNTSRRIDLAYDAATCILQCPWIIRCYLSMKDLLGSIQMPRLLEPLDYEHRVFESSCLWTSDVKNTSVAKRQHLMKGSNVSDKNLDFDKHANITRKGFFWSSCLLEIEYEASELIEYV